jgi:hypothetical protein
MGELLLFKPAARPPTASVPPEGAQILFFLGVRYERPADPVLPTPSARKVRKPAAKPHRAKKDRLPA